MSHVCNMYENKTECTESGIAFDVYCIVDKTSNNLEVQTIILLCVFSWDPTKRMTPDEGLQHEWILEGNFNKVRPRTKPGVKKAAESSTITENSSSLSFHKQENNKTGENTITERIKIRCEVSKSWGLNGAMLKPILAVFSEMDRG